VSVRVASTAVRQLGTGYDPPNLVAMLSRASDLSDLIEPVIALPDSLVRMPWVHAAGPEGLDTDFTPGPISSL
jgi:hypothetical protein